ncbi:hypothetical protein ASG93_20330 [Paenibacillus sp. Soil787]|nr:hypothetical protein ASG93_20330 [Paenibacillus sp. Soil787]
MPQFKAVLYTIVRILLGVIFLSHGWMKFQMWLGNVAHFFQSIGLPGTLGYVVAICELIGGIALVIGIGTRYVSIIFLIIMLGVIFKVKLGSGLMGSPESPGFELELGLTLAALYLAAENYWQFGLDRFFVKKNVDI